MTTVERVPPDLEALRDAITPPRLDEFLREFEGEDALPRAIELYAWNARLAAECFASIGHLEILLRNTLDRSLSSYFEEDIRGIPWFLQHGNDLSSEACKEIEAVRSQLTQRKRSDSRNRIIAQLTLGFWCSLLKPNYEGTLWTKSLHQCFKDPHTGKTPDRSVVARLADRVRQTRNRVAHHNYLRAFDVPRAMDAVFSLAGMMSPEFAKWMRQQSQWDTVYKACPKVDTDTVVIPSGLTAWKTYEEHSAYICQEGRFFRECTYLAFYDHHRIHAQVPRITSRHDSVEFTESNAQTLLSSEDPTSQRLGKLIVTLLTGQDPRTGRSEIQAGACHQVFLLTRARREQKGNDGHITLPEEIPHPRSGRGSAFTQKQRYISSHKLLTATTTDDL